MPKNLGRPVVGGLILIALGFFAIALGYNGAARRACVDCQLPYVLSGGILGLAFVVLGAGLIVFEALRRGRAHVEQKLDTLIEVLQNGVATAPPAEPSPTPPLAATRRRGQRAEQSAQNGRVVVGRASFHRPDCRLVEGKEDVDLATLDEATARGLLPCRVCDPLSTEQPARKR